VNANQEPRAKNQESRERIKSEGESCSGSSSGRIKGWDKRGKIKSQEPRAREKVAVAVAVAG